MSHLHATHPQAPHKQGQGANRSPSEIGLAIESIEKATEVAAKEGQDNIVKALRNRHKFLEGMQVMKPEKPTMTHKARAWILQHDADNYINGH